MNNWILVYSLRISTPYEFEHEAKERKKKAPVMGHVVEPISGWHTRQCRLVKGRHSNATRRVMRRRDGRGSSAQTP